MASVGDIIRVAVHYTQPNASDIMNVFHFVLSGSDITNASLRDALDTWIDTVWGSVWDGLASSQAEIDRFEADIVAADGTVLETIGGSSVNHAGTVGGEVMPPGVAGYIMAYTDVPKARGSKYVPGLSETNTTGGTLTSGALTLLANLLVLYLSTASVGGGASIVPGVLSKALSEFLPFSNAGTVDDRPAYQRRRKRDVGG